MDRKRAIMHALLRKNCSISNTMVDMVQLLKEFLGFFF